MNYAVTGIICWPLNFVYSLQFEPCRPFVGSLLIEADRQTNHLDDWISTWFYYPVIQSLDRSNK